MPTLLSPRGAKAEGDEPKKPKGMMGRLKSTFKLGRRKSSSSSLGGGGGGPTDKDDDDIGRGQDPENTYGGSSGPESVARAKRHPQQEDDDDEEEGPDRLGKGPVGPQETEIRAFDVKDNDDDEAPEAETDGHGPAESKKDDPTRVSTFEHCTTTSVATGVVVARAEDKCHGEEDEEVFAVHDAKHSDSDDEDAEDEDDDAVEVFAENNIAGGDEPQSLPVDKDSGAPHASDLMIVGVSPAKFRTTTGPSVSPVKRAQPPSLVIDASSNQSAVTTGPSPVDAAESIGDRMASAHSSRPPRAGAAAVPTSPSSPSPSAPRAPLLSEFQFGSETLGASPSSMAPQPSPMKRRGVGAPSPTARRGSFHRDQEQELAGAAAAAQSPTRKPDTPSALPPTTRPTRADRRSSLQGIREDVPPAEAPETEAAARPSSPRRVSREPPPGAARRRASMTEAPILASSFAGATSPSSPAPEVHEELPASGGVGAHEQHEDDDSTALGASRDDSGPGAFAFDAGAAITQEFGERVARLLGADPWGDRQDGFDAITYHIKKTDLASAKRRRELFCAAIAAVQCGVEDRVAPVMYCALECLRGILKEFAPVFDRAFQKYEPMNEQLSALAKSLVGKLGDSNKRTQREATQALVRLAKLKKLKVLPHVLLHLSAKEVAPRLRVEILRQLVAEVGVDGKTGLNVEVVMQFALPALKIAEEKTRKAAVELIADLHLINGQAVNAQLVGIKPEMLRVINRRVDELMTKREAERQQAAAQNANQAEDAAGDDEPVMELVAVPVEDAKATTALLEAQLHHAQSVVGPVSWRKLESKTWSDRKEALVDVEKTITEAKSDLRDVKPAFGSVVQQNFAAYCVVIHRCLADSIAPVVNSSMDCFATLIKVYGPCVEWREESVRDVILLTIMRLFSTMQKPNNRTNRAACRCILKLTRLTNPHTLRYALSAVFAKETDALVQMHLLRLLVPEFGFQADGLSPHLVLGAVAVALGSSNDKVRKTAIDVASCTQRLVGRELVLSRLKDVKPVTLKEVERSFVEDVQKDGERPQTVHATAVPSSTSGAGPMAHGAALPPVQFGSHDNSRRLLNSAPVGLGKLHCLPPNEEERESEFSGALRRASVLSNEEENLMDAILGQDDF